MKTLWYFFHLRYFLWKLWARINQWLFYVSTYTHKNRAVHVVIINENAGPARYPQMLLLFIENPKSQWILLTNKEGCNKAMVGYIFLWKRKTHTCLIYIDHRGIKMSKTSSPTLQVRHTMCSTQSRRSNMSLLAVGQVSADRKYEDGDFI